MVDATDEIDPLIQKVDTSAKEVGSAMSEQSPATGEIVESAAQTLPAVENASVAMQFVLRSNSLRTSRVLPMKGVDLKRARMETYLRLLASRIFRLQAL